MLTSLNIFDTNTVSIGKPENMLTVRVSGENISVRELLRLRISQEVEAYNQNQPAVFRMLVQPHEAERTLNGFRLPTPRFIDPQTQFEKAIEAFEGNGFVVLVDERQVVSLETQIALRPETTITFLKLIPLVGG